MRVVAVVVLSTAVLSVAPRSKAGRAMAVLSAIAAATVLLLIHGPVAHWISMVVGVPSIASIAWLADFAFRRAFDLPLFDVAERRMLLSAMAVLSLVLYPSALGYVNIDIYRLGFSAVAPLAIGAAGIALAVTGRFHLAVLALVVLVTLDVQLLPSANAFDYVIDPAGGFGAIVWAAVHITRWASARPLMRFRAGAFHAERESGAAGVRPAPE